MLSDIFYPDNPKRREQLIRKGQELRDLMKNNFRATNQLNDAMNKHLSCSFEHITLNESASLRENCTLIMGCMCNIMVVVERIDRELKEKLEPTMYEKLRKLSLSSADFKAISKAFEAVCGIATVESTVFAGYLIDNVVTLANITKTYAIIGAGKFACVRLAVVFLGIDMIVKDIIGKIERDQLKKALEEYDKVLDEFRPASEQYQDKITYVRVKIEMEKEDMLV
ncbi:single-pass membrane and coiled-coil domain-containing protein 3-like [Sinocyclocheilus rhinocerous]|uniref:Single-pass membrane and coiled-coil domain-containing protein 3-like n=1 Tax=Sinocyclocheilus rhinocerous TaxID=307959 RepID=A0A673KVA4_9TELE|nr:PREDICTED: single-pass membrane and coiled-coil domain-containing protein 3-like [Sinocyclocheilus rhinocerous]